MTKERDRDRTERHFGHISRVNIEKGYGFILDTSEDEAVERFFHASDYTDDEPFDTLEKDDEVSFIPVSGARGPKAVDVLLDLLD